VSDNTFAITMRVEEVGQRSLGASGKQVRIMRGVADGQYPQWFEVDCWNKDIVIPGIGQTVRACGELRGRLHQPTGRIYYSLAAESIEAVGGSEETIPVDPMDMIPDRKPEPKPEQAKPTPTPQPQQEQTDFLDETPPF
jgi:hypothetical protein